MCQRIHVLLVIALCGPLLLTTLTPPSASSRAFASATAPSTYSPGIDWSSWFSKLTDLVPPSALSPSSASYSVATKDSVSGDGDEADEESSATSDRSVSKALGNVVRGLPAVRLSNRFNQADCVGGTKCQFFFVCWMSGGSLGSSCGPLYTCCVTASSQSIQPAFYGPVVNDPYCGRSSSRISRIVGGKDAAFGQFPWQAFVQVGGSRCGGALVGPRHVVTAGHCVARSQHTPTSIRVTLGDYILHSDLESLPHETFTVAEVRLHPNFRFTPQADRFDVAVLILDRVTQYRDNIKPICLPQKDASFLGRTSYVAGWGALQAGSKLRPKVLQHVAVPVIENPVCEGWHQKRGINIRIHDEMMCAGYEFGGKDACQGDSGGPLMLNDYGVWYLIGIVSAGYSCAKQYQPGIYHRVSSSSDWISANVYQAETTKRKSFFSSSS
ncbi:Serine proteinase stubble [Halotydeus destructor]|nr:Serine proteinase stubble [Halotydeus destructor]